MHPACALVSGPRRRRSGSVVLDVVGAAAGQPGGQPLDGHLEVGVLVHEGLELVGQPGEGHLLLAPPRRQLLQPPVGEVHGRLPGSGQSAKASATSWRCSTSWTLAEPTAGLADARRLTRRSVRPEGRCSGRLTAMNCHAPMFAASSCTHTTSVAFGYCSSTATICWAGSG